MKNTFSATFSVLFFPSISVSWVRGGGRGEEWFCSGGKDREAHTFDVRLYRQPRWTRRKSGNSSNVNLFVTNGPRNCFLIFIPLLPRLLRFEEYREIMRPAHGTCPLQSRTLGNELFFFLTRGKIKEQTFTSTSFDRDPATKEMLFNRAVLIFLSPYSSSLASLIFYPFQNA